MNAPLLPHSADALLFDLGRVVLDIDFGKVAAIWAGHAGCEPAQLVGRFSPNDSWQRHERGEISDAEFFENLRALARHRDLGRPVPGRLERDLHRRNARHRRIAGACRTSLPLYAFSNTNSAHVAHFSQAYADVLGHFREIYLSSTIGLRKPEAAAYDHVVKAIGMPASRIVFFDDSADNIAGARARGLTAVHVTSPDDVAKALAALGI